MTLFEAIKSGQERERRKGGREGRHAGTQANITLHFKFTMSRLEGRHSWSLLQVRKAELGKSGDPRAGLNTCHL